MTDSTHTPRDLFCAVFDGKKVGRPPFWMMRQAGRYLPEYRKLKQKYGFLELVKTPELAAEVSLQPIRRFGFDCAIVFSDILVLSEALGLPYSFKEAGGIALPRTVRTLADVDALNDNPENLRQKLSYVAETLKILRAELPDRALIGFCGSPFTVGAYMVEGQSGSNFQKYSEMARENCEVFSALIKKLGNAAQEYVKMQLECGVDAVQVFDSHAALAPEGRYFELSGRECAKILELPRRNGGRARSILFANGMGGRFSELLQTKADAYSISSEVSLGAVVSEYGGEFCLQGNLDAALLSEATADEVRKAAKKIISEMLPHGRHIFNLGHGIRPDAKIENVEALCGAVMEFK